MKLLLARLVHLIIPPKLQPVGWRGRLWWWAVGVKIEHRPVEMCKLVLDDMRDALQRAADAELINGGSIEPRRPRERRRDRAVYDDIPDAGWSTTGVASPDVAFDLPPSPSPSFGGFSGGESGGGGGGGSWDSGGSSDSSSSDSGGSGGGDPGS